MSLNTISIFCSYKRFVKFKVRNLNVSLAQKFKKKAGAGKYKLIYGGITINQV